MKNIAHALTPDSIPRESFVLEKLNYLDFHLVVYSNYLFYNSCFILKCILIILSPNYVKPRIVHTNCYGKHRLMDLPFYDPLIMLPKKFAFTPLFLHAYFHMMKPFNYGTSSLEFSKTLGSGGSQSFNVHQSQH